jgi:Flp pilus assembly protein TadB
MLTTIAAILALIWAFGTATSYTLGGFLHVLVIFAVALPIIQLIRRRSQRTSKFDHESRIHIGKTTAS